MTKQHFEVLDEFGGDLADVCQEIIDLREQVSLIESEKSDLEYLNEELELKVGELEKLV